MFSPGQTLGERRGHSPPVIHSWDVPARLAAGSVPSMRTLIAAVTLATTAAFGSTAYAAPTAPTTSSYVAPHAGAAIDTCALSSLPSQAADTLDLIHSGG